MSIDKIKMLSDEELLNLIKDGYRQMAGLIFIYVEAKMRRHECQFHGRMGSVKHWDEVIEKLESNIMESFESLAL